MRLQSLLRYFHKLWANKYYPYDNKIEFYNHMVQSVIRSEKTKRQSASRISPNQNACNADEKLSAVKRENRECGKEVYVANCQLCYATVKYTTYRQIHSLYTITYIQCCCVYNYSVV